MSKSDTSNKRFAVIDTETNIRNQVMSIGVVIADAETFAPVDERYYILEPERSAGGMFSMALLLPDCYDAPMVSRREAIDALNTWLCENEVDSLFAYNASFDKSHLEEFSNYKWYDIMRIAAYKQHNSAITNRDECFANGKMKRGYGVEAMIRRLSPMKNYCEKHNALHDARDELTLMVLLKHSVDYYPEYAYIGGGNSNNKGTKHRTEQAAESRLQEPREEKEDSLAKYYGVNAHNYARRSVNFIYMPSRITGALYEGGIKTVEDLLLLSWDDIARIEGIGSKSIFELKKQLYQFLQVKPNDDDREEIEEAKNKAMAEAYMKKAEKHSRTVRSSSKEDEGGNDIETGKAILIIFTIIFILVMYNILARLW